MSPSVVTPDAVLGTQAHACDDHEEGGFSVVSVSRLPNSAPTMSCIVALHCCAVALLPKGSC
jgi:hypothetical protein